MTSDNIASLSSIEVKVMESDFRVVSLPGGRAIVASLVLTALISLAADFNDTHLFNPKWPPHAVFHDAAMLHLLTGVCLLALWLLFRRTKEPDVAAFVGFATPVIFWTPFFWLTSVMPNASLNALETPPPTIGGMSVLPNVITAGLLVLLSTWGFSSYRRGTRRT
jgi:hypothetical protein